MSSLASKLIRSRTREDEEENRIGTRPATERLSSLDLPESSVVSGLAGRLKAGLAAAGPKLALADTAASTLPVVGGAYEATRDAVGAGLGWVVDKLSRGQYAMAAGAAAGLEHVRERPDSYTDAVVQQAVGTIATVKAFAREAVNPTQKLSFFDVLKKNEPTFVEKNPRMAYTLGLAGDILLDPLNFVGLGEAKTGLKVVSAAGKKVIVNRNAAASTMRELLEATGEGVAPGIADRLRRAVLRPNPAERATAEKLDSVMKARRADIDERYGKLLQDIDDRLGEAHIGVPVELEGGVRQAAARGGGPQMPLFASGGDIREELLNRRRKIVEEYQAELTVQEKLQGRIDNALAAPSMERAEHLRTFLEQEPAPIRVAQLVEDTAEARFAKLLDDPDFLARVQDDGGIKVGVGRASGSIVPGKVFQRVGEVLGVPKVRERLKQLADEPLAAAPMWLRPVGALAKAGDRVMSDLNRNWRLPDEYVAARKELEARTVAAHRQATREAMAIFKGLDKNSREKVNALARRLDDLRGSMTKRGKEVGVDPEGKPIFASATEADIEDALHGAVSDAKLTQDEWAAFVKMRQRFNDFRAIEQELGLLEGLVENYHPRVYRLISSAKDWFGAKRLNNRNLSNFFGHGEARSFTDEAAAKAAGYSPVTDAMALYIMRATAHQRAVGREVFRKRVEDMFMTTTKEGEKKQLIRVSRGNMELQDIPTRRKLIRDSDKMVAEVYEDAPATLKAVQRDIQYIGESLYQEGASRVLSGVMPLYDGMLGFVRKAATIVRPAFALKQGISNLQQGFLALGSDVFRPGSIGLAMSAIKAMRAFDPRATLDAAMILSGESGGFAIRTALGTRLTGQQVADLAMKHGVVRGVTLDGVGAKEVGTSRWAKMIDRELKKNDLLIRGNGTLSQKALDGFRRAMGAVSHYTDWASKVEDFSRLTIFANALRMGHAPTAAAQLVDDALFDYMHGLSKFETRVARRVMPFYSYRRFAIPMMAKVFAKTPGRVANLAKATDRFFEIYGKVQRGEALTEEEQTSALPGWIVDQPHAVAEHVSVFKHLVHTFNGFSPIDVLSEFMPGEDDFGKEGPKRWIEKSFLAQMTPFIKVPVETFFNKEFFTGREIDPSRKRNIKDLDPRLFLSTLTAEVTMSASGRASLAGAAGLASGQLSPKAAEKVLSVLLGWEEGVNREGKPTVYVSPYRWALASGFFPALTDAAKFSNREKSPLGRARHFLFGVNEVEVDVKRDKEMKLSRMKKVIDEKAREAQIAEINQQIESRDQALKDLDELVQVFNEELQLAEPILSAPQ